MKKLKMMLPLLATQVLYCLYVYFVSDFLEKEGNKRRKEEEEGQRPYSR